MISGAFINFLLHNHFITEKILKKKSGEAKDSVIFSFLFLLHKRAKPIHPPYLLSLPTYPPIPPPTYPPIPPPTLKIPPSKAWRRLYRANATSPRAGHCIASRASQPAGWLHRIPCSAGMNQPAAQRIASQTIRAPCSAPPAPITSPPRIARRARHTPRTCSSAHALRSTLRSFIWFVVLTFTKFNLYTSRIAISLCVRSSVGSQY